MLQKEVERARMYQLNDNEKKRLINAMRAAFATDLIDDVEDYVWERIFAYTKQAKCVDPLAGRRTKRLYDVLDTNNKIGWSAKTHQGPRLITPPLDFEVVIQRADIIKKAASLGFPQGLTRDSDPDDLGRALLRHWYRKVHGDAQTQGVYDKRVCILVKSKDHRQFAYYEDNIHVYSEEELYWKWTDSSKNGLQGIRKEDGRLVFRWYPNQTHLFERFTLPADAYLFTLTPERIDINDLIDFVIKALEHKP